MATKLADLKAREYELRDGRNGGMEIMLCCVANMKGPDRWAIRKGRYCLTKSGEWEYEPMPSSRDEAFFSRARFKTAEAALKVWDRCPEARA